MALGASCSLLCTLMQAEISEENFSLELERCKEELDELREKLAATEGRSIGSLAAGRHVSVLAPMPESHRGHGGGGGGGRRGSMAAGPRRGSTMTGRRQSTVVADDRRGSIMDRRGTRAMDVGKVRTALVDVSGASAGAEETWTLRVLQLSKELSAEREARLAAVKQCEEAEARNVRLNRRLEERIEAEAKAVAERDAVKLDGDTGSSDEWSDASEEEDGNEGGGEGGGEEGEGAWDSAVTKLADKQKKRAFKRRGTIATEEKRTSHRAAELEHLGTKMQLTREKARRTYLERLMGLVGRVMDVEDLAFLERMAGSNCDPADSAMATCRQRLDEGGGLSLAVLLEQAEREIASIKQAPPYNLPTVAYRSLPLPSVTSRYRLLPYLLSPAAGLDQAGARQQRGEPNVKGAEPRPPSEGAGAAGTSSSNWLSLGSMIVPSVVYGLGTRGVPISLALQTQ